MKYKTQMEAAKAGFVTEQMKIVAQKEGVSCDYLLEKIACGEIVIPANVNHKSLSPEGIGTGLRTKINVNLGISKDLNDLDLEMEKVDMAIKMGAESIMDLSNYGKTQVFREMLIEKSPAMIGTVPMYDAVGFLEKGLTNIEAREFLDVVRNHAENGVDFVTIHAGINRQNAGLFLRNRRVNEIVSRGGSLLFSRMMMKGEENPFFEYYDELLDILRQYDVTLSLGDSLRPGGIFDATDPAQISELITLGELAKRAWEKDVQVMIEGPGHVPLGDIKTNIDLEKRLCHKAPFYVLGPLVTDIAPGYDHITSAIGGAIAAACGADFLCYVTPAEHLRLPDLSDVKEGIVAAKIAAHAGDIEKIPESRNRDLKMSKARQRLDREEMFNLALDPEKARAYRASSEPSNEITCTMCGDMCSVKNMNLILEGKKID